LESTSHGHDAERILDHFCTHRHLNTVLLTDLFPYNQRPHYCTTPSTAVFFSRCVPRRKIFGRAQHYTAVHR